MPKPSPSQARRPEDRGSSKREPPSLYTRGDWRLWYDEGRDGRRRSPNLYVYFYDKQTQRVRSRSTGTAILEQAKLKLDELYENQFGQEVSFCPSCGRPKADGFKLPVATVLGQYWKDVGSKRASSSSINARIKHILDWLEQEDREEMVCAAFDNGSADAFRTWSREAPVVVNGKVRAEPRAPSTTEESLHILRAAFQHAKKSMQLDVVPDFDTYERKQVSNPILVRVDLPVIAKMLQYAAQPNKRREQLHAFLVGSICTLARPGAVLDISVSASRRQWHRGSRVLHLNPGGRIQTKKWRPSVWVPPQLELWLEDRSTNKSSGGWLVHRSGEKVESVDTAWDTMRDELGLPYGIEYGSYIIRRSMATILRNWHKHGGTMVDYRELQEQMGHAKQTTTDSYALNEISAQTTVQKALSEVLAKLEQLAPGTMEPPAPSCETKAG